MEPVLSKKNQFKKTPYIDPRNGQEIIIGSKEYKQLVKLYGEPLKIKSPKTKHLISVNKISYKNLIKEGYTDKQIIEQSSINLFVINNNVDIPQEILQEIMLNADIKTIHQYCLTNKNALNLCQ